MLRFPKIGDICQHDYIVGGVFLILRVRSCKIPGGFILDFYSIDKRCLGDTLVFPRDLEYLTLVAECAEALE